MARSWHAWMAALILLGAGTLAMAEDDTAYSVAPWVQDLGNFRATAAVLEPADAVRLHIPWRRRDADPEKKDIMLVDANSDQRITNVVHVEVNRDFADLVFQPGTSNAFFVYYMRCTESGPNHQYVTNYTPADTTPADPAWIARNKLGPEDLKNGGWKNLPEAKLLAIQARTEFDRRDPMELVASAGEIEALAAKYPDSTYLVFPEDRRFCIRMMETIPERWTARGPHSAFQGTADLGEYYVFQLGVFAMRQPIEDIELEFRGIDGIVGADGLHCINLGGTDWLGRAFRKPCAVPQGHVQPLWCGFAVPADATPGMHDGSIVVKPKGAAPTEIKLALRVTGETIDDAGDGDLWRMARLRWLDSTIGLDDDVVAPYTPLAVDGRTVVCLGRQVQFDGQAMPEQIRSGNRELLAAPICMYAETDEGRLPWKGGAAKIVKRAPGVDTWESSSTAGGITCTCSATMEFDGYINYRCTIKASAQARLKDMGLEIPLRRDAAGYLMGMGKKGGFRPDRWEWKWDPARANNCVWVGDAGVGIQCKLKGPEDAWNLYALGEKGIPDAWNNGGKGGCVIEDKGGDQAVIRAFTGERELKAGEELVFCFGLLITPVKPLDPRHWSWRYQHEYIRMSEFDNVQGNILNIHQGNELNPYINYPFGNARFLTSYVYHAHQRGLKIKLYYTVRELSNHAAEIWPLRSLGDEVYVDGPGGGCSWLCEHLVDHYAPAWHEPNLPNGEIDGAIATTGLSRWHNYYLEGMQWLLKNAEIDGLYLDGIGYDRVIMQRLRKVMERTRPGSLIDFHSGNNFEPAYGLSSPANQYMEHFPYIDSLWFGEGYDYNETPDYWLTEISGIPFGLFGEMLQGGGNPWRGMIYGMTNRLGWQGDPRPIWKLWDAFGIQDARMIGYWEPDCPVKTSNPDVLATVYAKKGTALIALASWAKDAAACTLAIDWQALGLDSAKAALHAPAIEGFQEEKTFAPGDAIPVEPARGWLLCIEGGAP